MQQKGERVEIYKMEKRVIDKAVKVGAASVETKVALSIMQQKCRKCVLFASGTEKRCFIIFIVLEFSPSAC